MDNVIDDSLKSKILVDIIVKIKQTLISLMSELIKWFIENLLDLMHG